MSKELIEQLAKEHCTGTIGGQFESERRYSFTPDQLEAFAKAYQAAAPIDNVAEALEKALAIALEYTQYSHERRLITSKIRALIPDTQAYAQTQGQSNVCHVISYSEDSGLVAMSSAVAHDLLLIRDALNAKYYDEAEALLVGIADPSLSNINTWQDLERIAAPIAVDADAERK
jgi:hypothetical protein